MRLLQLCVLALVAVTLCCTAVQAKSNLGRIVQRFGRSNAQHRPAPAALLEKSSEGYLAEHTPLALSPFPTHSVVDVHHIHSDHGALDLPVAPFHHHAVIANHGGISSGYVSHASLAAHDQMESQRRSVLYAINRRDDEIHAVHHDYIAAQNQLEQQAASFQAWIRAAEASAQREFDAHKRVVDSLKQRLDSLNKAQTADRTKLSSLSSQIDKSLYEARLRASNAQLKRAEEFESDLQKRLEEAQARKAALEGEVSNINSAIEAIGGEAPAEEAAPAAEGEPAAEGGEEAAPAEGGEEAAAEGSEEAAPAEEEAAE